MKKETYSEQIEFTINLVTTSLKIKPRKFLELDESDARIFKVLNEAINWFRIRGYSKFDTEYQKKGNLHILTNKDLAILYHLENNFSKDMIDTSKFKDIIFITGKQIKESKTENVRTLQDKRFKVPHFSQTWVKYPQLFDKVELYKDVFIDDKFPLINETDPINIILNGHTGQVIKFTQMRAGYPPSLQVFYRYIGQLQMVETNVEDDTNSQSENSADSMEMQ